MSEEMVEIFKVMKEVNKIEKRENGDLALRILHEANVKYDVLEPNIPHLLVVGRFDFWPTTGKYRDRKTGKYHLGIFKLMESIK